MGGMPYNTSRTPSEYGQSIRLRSTCKAPFALRAEGIRLHNAFRVRAVILVERLVILAEGIQFHIAFALQAE